VGIVGPHTLNPDGSHQSTRRRFPSILTGMFESTWLQRIVPLNSFYVRDLPDAGTFDVDWVQGSALMTRREVYAQIGGLDELYVMYFEELDFCKRAKKSGWRVLYVGDAYITHHGGGSADQVQTQKHVHFQTSKLRYFRKFHGWPVSLLLRMVLIVNYGAQVLIEGAKLLRGHKPELRRERIRSYGVVLRALVGR
jgi:GT2 family glycosyltransferase